MLIDFYLYRRLFGNLILGFILMRISWNIIQKITSCLLQCAELHLISVWFFITIHSRKVAPVFNKWLLLLVVKIIHWSLGRTYCSWKYALWHKHKLSFIIFKKNEYVLKYATIHFVKFCCEKMVQNKTAL